MKYMAKENLTTTQTSGIVFIRIYYIWIGRVFFPITIVPFFRDNEPSCIFIAAFRRFENIKTSEGAENIDFDILITTPKKVEEILRRKIL